MYYVHSTIAVCMYDVRCISSRLRTCDVRTREYCGSVSQQSAALPHLTPTQLSTGSALQPPHPLPQTAGNHPQHTVRAQKHSLLEPPPAT